jgi:hypothetical protein
MSDFTTLSIAVAFAVSSWLLLVLCDRLIGGKP